MINAKRCKTTLEQMVESDMIRFGLDPALRSDIIRFWEYKLFGLSMVRSSPKTQEESILYR